MNNCKVTQGKVVDFFHGYKEVLNPIVSFKMEDGMVVRFRESFGTKPPQYEKGEIVRVVYDPVRHEHAKIDSFWLFRADLLPSDDKVE